MSSHWITENAAAYLLDAEYVVTIRDFITGALGEFVDDYDIDGIEADFRAQLDAILGDKATLAGEMIAAEVGVDLDQDALREAAANVDFWTIAERHDGEPLQPLLDRTPCCHEKGAGHGDMCTVRSQKELLAAIREAVEFITIDAPRSVWLDVPANASVMVSGESRVEAHGGAYIKAYENADVRATGSVRVEAYDATNVSAGGGAHVVAHDASTVTASGYADVVAYGTSTVRARDCATVHAFTQGNVRATSHVAIHVHDPRGIVEGGVQVSHHDEPRDAAAWCAWHDVQVVDGIATLYVAVDESWADTTHADAANIFSPGSLPVSAVWHDDHQLVGGLRLRPHPQLAYACGITPGERRIMAVGVYVSELRTIRGAGPLAKAPRVVVACREVDIDGLDMDAERNAR